MKKTKPSNVELAFQSYARSDADSKNSEISMSSFFLPSLVAKLDPNEKNEVRLSAIRTLTESFTKNCAHSRDDRMSDVAVSSLREIILSKKSKNEHNEALRLICAFSLGRRSEFSVRAKMLINDLLPSIENLSSEYDAYRTFAISFLTANSIEGREDSLEIFKSFLDTFINATTTTVKSNKNQFQHKNKAKNQNSHVDIVNNENDGINSKKNEDSINNNEADSNTNNEKSCDSNNINANDNFTTTINDTTINNDQNSNSNNNNNAADNNDNENKDIKMPLDQGSTLPTSTINQDTELPINDTQNNSIQLDQQNQDSNTTSITQPASTNLQIESSPIHNQLDSTETVQQTQNQDTSTFSLKRRAKFKGSTQSLRELLQGAALIASSLPAEAAAEDLIDELTTIIGITIGADDESYQVDPLLATDGLDLFLVVQECLIERHEELHISQSSTNSVNNFISHFRPYIESLHNRANLEGGNKGKNKAREKALRAKIADVLRCVDGFSKRSIDLAFNEQRVTIEGTRRVIIAEAVKRVTQKNFLSHLQANTALQNDLGFSLISNQSAVKLMKRFKPEIKQERVMSKKEREMDRNKKRKMKEERNQNYDD